MKRSRLGALSLFAVVAGLLLPDLSAPQTAETNSFLWVSDVHLDPAPETKDTSQRLFNSVVEELAREAPQTQFMVVTGDILPHRNLGKEGALALFRRVAAQFQGVMGGRSVLFTLGNNDSYCGDYKLQPNGPFLADTAATITKMLGELADGETERDWKSWGSYSVRLPDRVLRSVQIIAFNTVFFSPRYHNTCGMEKDEEVAHGEMNWLRRKLNEAKGKSVWLIYHIPPGIDGFATGENASITKMWTQAYTDEFEQILRDYSGTVKISLAAHEHMDDFRLIDHSLILLAPAISPNHRQNPALRVVSYTSGGELSDATTYYLSNLTAFRNGQPPEWKRYSVSENWHSGRLDYADFKNLFDEVNAHPDEQQKWVKQYSVYSSELSEENNRRFRELFCAAGTIDDSEYKECRKSSMTEPSR
jgi:hypothetical protein